MGKSSSSSSSSSSSDSSDDDWKNVSKHEKKMRKKWKKQMKKGGIPHGSIPPWQGGPAWYPPTKGGKKGKSGKGKIQGYPGAVPQGMKPHYTGTGCPTGPASQYPQPGYAPAGNLAGGYQPPPPQASHYPPGGYPSGVTPLPVQPQYPYPQGSYGQPGAPQGPFQAPPEGNYPPQPGFR